MLTDILLQVSPEGDSAALASIQLRARLLDAMLLLVTRGVALPVLAALRAFFDGADQALVRHALLRLLPMVAPPFSAPFASSLLGLIGHSRVREAFRPDARMPLIAALDAVATSAECVASHGPILAQLKTAATELRQQFASPSSTD